MKEQPEMLTKVNAAIQLLAEESGSELINDLQFEQIFLNPDSYCNCDYQFGCIPRVHAEVWVSGAEISTYSDNELQEYMRVKIRHSMYDMIALLEDELEKLR